MAYWESDSINTYSYLREGSDQLARDLYNDLKVHEEGYFWNARFRSGIWDGYARYFDYNERRVLTGMVTFAKQLGYDLEEKITAENPLNGFNQFLLKDPYNEGDIELNSYQNESLGKIVTGIRRGIFDHITAAGKTVEIGGICALLNPLRVLIIVPTIELLMQTKEDLATMLGEEIGQLGSGKKELDHRITVMYGGFVKRATKHPFVKDLAKRTQVLIADELQTVTTRLFPFFKKCVNAYYRFGFSGSFFEIDPARIFSVAGYFGEVITTVTDEDTKKEQRTVSPSFTFFEFPVKDESGHDYSVMYEKCLVKNDAFNMYFAERVKPHYDNGETILVLVKRRDHCKKFQEFLRRINVESEIYNGAINTEQRRQLRSQFKNGLLPVLIATEQTLGVGVNIPRIELLLNLGCGLSNNATKQKYGRSLRTFEDKKSVTIYEPYVTSNKILLKHSKSRMKLAKTYSTGNVKLVLLNGT